MILPPPTSTRTDTLLPHTTPFRSLTIAGALQGSLNIPAFAVLSEVGTLRFTDALRRSGAALRLPRGAGRAHLPVILGGAAISLRDVTGLFAGLAEIGRAHV